MNCAGLPVRRAADYAAWAIPSRRNTKLMNEFDAWCARLETRLMPLTELAIEPERIAQAAVTLILRPHAEGAEGFVIKRAEHPRDPWSGHLALPGGRADATDADLRATAMREVWEEIGVRLDAGGQFLGRLPKLTPNNPRLPRIEITPFVAVAPEAFEVQANAEVAASFWVSVASLKASGMNAQYTMMFDGKERAWPAYASPGGPIWGITGRILSDFLKLLD
jgi:8-oxo-dGTP pyrophosphatase MutT (NUDIX family)